MSGKLLIPLCFFIICNSIYDAFGEIQNTNWSVFYYTSQYFAWLLLIFLLPKPRPFIKKIPYYVMGFGLGIYIFIELCNLGIDYKDYYLNVNSIENIILPVSAIITGLTIYILKTCQQ